MIQKFKNEDTQEFEFEANSIAEAQKIAEENKSPNESLYEARVYILGERHFDLSIEEK